MAGRGDYSELFSGPDGPLYFRLLDISSHILSTPNLSSEERQMISTIVCESHFRASKAGSTSAEFRTLPEVAERLPRVYPGADSYLTSVLGYEAVEQTVA
jgi:hypothetical protein